MAEIQLLDESEIEIFQYVTRSEDTAIFILEKGNAQPDTIWMKPGSLQRFMVEINANYTEQAYATKGYSESREVVFRPISQTNLTELKIQIIARHPQGNGDDSKTKLSFSTNQWNLNLVHHAFYTVPIRAVTITQDKNELRVYDQGPGFYDIYMPADSLLIKRIQ